MNQYPCACPPFSRPVKLVAMPAMYPRYVIPCSHLLDAPYSKSLNPGYPYPRMPRAYESETRADGTGLVWGPSTTTPPCPCPPPPCPPQTAAMQRRWGW